MGIWICVFLLCLPSFAGAADKTITIDGSSGGRIFEGIGAVSAGGSSRLLIDYREPYRSQILDYLFKPGYGAALQHLKVEIGSDVNSTGGSEPSHMRSRDDHNYKRGYEWWLMEEARKRNPNIILDALAWGAPGWIGGGKLQSSDMAEYEADFLKGAQSAHNLHIDYAGIWNEHESDPDFVKKLRSALHQQRLDTKIVCCDLYPGQGKGQWSIADLMAQDPELKNAVEVVGAHYPLDTHGKITTTNEAKNLNKPLWSSEDQPNAGNGPILSRDWKEGGKILAKLYNRNYLDGAMTKTEIWSPITSYYDVLGYAHSGLMSANTPWSGYYQVQGAIWVTAHTTQFAQPGWQYLDGSSGFLAEGGSYVSLKSPNGQDWSTILETVDAKRLQSVEFAIAGVLANKTVFVWETNENKTFELVSEAKPEEGRFVLNVEPDSLYTLTTTTGQGKGTARPPAPKPFPSRYRENFKKTPVGKTPRFLSDQDGAFEVQPCEHRKGKCLEQVISEKPIPWFAAPDPYTLAGDVNWEDYRIKVDVLLDGPGPVTIIGRIDSGDMFQKLSLRWPSGYVLSIQPDGRWSLLSSLQKSAPIILAQGRIAESTKRWVPVELRFEGHRIVAVFNGRKIADTMDIMHTHGMFAVGTSWNKAQFHHLSVSKTASR